HADVHPRANARPLDFKVGLNDRNLRRLSGVPRSERPRTGSPPDVLADDQIAGIKIALRTDPRVVADDAGTFRAPLDEGLFADKYAVAILKRLQMRGDGAAADPHAVAEATC